MRPSKEMNNHGLEKRHDEEDVGTSVANCDDIDGLDSFLDPKESNSTSSSGGVGAFRNDLAKVDGLSQRRILYRVGIIRGQYNIAEVYCRRPAKKESRVEDLLTGDHARDLSRRSLKTGGVFVLDCATEVFVWFGKQSSFGVRLAGAQVAQRLIDIDDARPSWCSLTQVNEGAEPFIFRSKFVDWLAHDAHATASNMLRRRRASLVATGQLHAVTTDEAMRRRFQRNSALASRSTAEKKKMFRTEGHAGS